MERGLFITRVLPALIALALGPIAAYSQSAPQSFTYEGRLYDNAGNPLNDNSVTFTFQIRSPNGACLLYEETQTIDLSGSASTAGVFALQVGSPIGAAKRSSAPADLNLSMKSVFANQGVVIRAADPTYCPGGYTPASGDDRVLRVIVNASGVPEALSPDARISGAPFAMVAETLNGHSESDFVKVSSVPACAGGEALFYDGSTWTCVTVSGGTLTGLSAGTGVSISGSAPTLTVAVNVGVGANQIVQLNGSGQLPAVSGANLTNISGAQLTDNTIADGKISGISGSKVAGAIAGNAAGFTGSLSGDVTGNQGTTTVTKLQGRDVASTPAPLAGQVLTWSDISSKWEPQAVPDSADNLGDHTATTNIKLGSNWLSGDGGAEGIKIDSAGNVTVSGHLAASGNVLVSGQISIAGGVPGAGKILTSDANGLATWQTPAGAGGGEVNTASNQGVSGVGVYIAKNSFDLQFRNINSGSTKITIFNDSANQEIDIDVNESNLTLDNLNGTLGINKGGTGAMTASDARANLGLGTAAVADMGLVQGNVLAYDDVPECMDGQKLRWDGPGPVYSWVCEDIRYSDLVSASGTYLTYKPNDTACNPGEVLKWNGSEWLCATDIDTNTTVAAGTNGEIQYHSGGNLGATSNFRWGSGALQIIGGANGAMGITLPAGANSPNPIAEFVNLSSTAGNGNGLYIQAGSAVADLPFLVTRSSGETLFSMNAMGKTQISVYQIGQTPALQLKSEANSNLDQGPVLEFYSKQANNITPAKSSGIAGILTDNTTGNYDGALVFSTANNSAFAERMRISSDGNVGIGTTSPQARLDIAGADAMIVPRGLTGNRPVLPVNGMIRYNAGTFKFEAYENGSWVNMIGGGVTSVGATAPLSVSGSATPTISLSDSGVTENTYGSGSFVPVLQISAKGLVTGAHTESITIPASQITQSGAANNNTLKWNGTTWVADSVSGALGYTPLNKAGDSMTGDLNMGSRTISNVGEPIATGDATTKGYVDGSISSAIGSYLMKAGDTMSGILDMDSNRIINVADPIDAQDAATRNYVDTKIAGRQVDSAPPAAGDTLVFDGAKWVYTPNPYPQPARLVLFNDFVGGLVDFLAADSLWEHHQFVLSTTGTGSKISFVSPASAADLNHPGIIRLESGTTASGLAAVVGCSVDVSGTGYLSKQFLLGGGPLEYEVMLKYNLTTAGVTYRIGLTNVPDNAPPTKGLWVDHPGGAAAQWRYNATGTASTGSVPFGSTAASGAWTKIRISVNSDASQVTFQINNDVPVEILNSTYIPTNPSTDALCPTVLVMNSASGNKSLDLDYLNLTQTFSTSR